MDECYSNWNGIFVSWSFQPTDFDHLNSFTHRWTLSFSKEQREFLPSYWSRQALDDECLYERKRSMPNQVSMPRSNKFKSSLMDTGVSITSLQRQLFSIHGEKAFSLVNKSIEQKQDARQVRLSTTCGLRRENKYIEWIEWMIYHSVSVAKDKHGAHKHVRTRTK